MNAQNRSVYLYVTLIVLGAVGVVALSIRFDPSILDTTASITGVLAFVAIGLALELTGHGLVLGSGASASVGFVISLSAAMVYGPTLCAAVTGTIIAAAQVLNR